MPAVEGLIRRIRKSGPNPVTSQQWWPTWNWRNGNASGASVNDDSALSLTTFYRGVSLIASTIAALPLHVYSESDSGSSERVKTPETRYLWGRPNVEDTRQTMWEKVIADEVRGNGFLWVEKDGLERPLSLWHVSRRRMRVGRTTSGMKVYELDNELPMIDYRSGGEIVHIPNWGDGLAGYDIVKVAGEALGLGMSAQEYVARTFASGEIPPGILTSEQELSEKQSDAIAERWTQQRAGMARAQKIAVLGKGAKFQTIDRDMEKMQMAALRSFQAGEIATLLGIPPHMLGLVDKTTSWGTGIENQTRGFATYTLQHHIKRHELAVDDALLVRELTGRFMKFDMGGLLRGTTLQQYQAHVLGWGRFLTANEIRADLDMPPVEGGDVLMQPTNMAPIDAFEGLKLGQEDAPPNGGGGQA